MKESSNEEDRNAAPVPPPPLHAIVAQPISQVSNSPDVRPLTTSPPTAKEGRAGPAAPAYHPEYMFCGSCTTCGPAIPTQQSTPEMMSSLMQIPVKKRKKKVAYMKFVQQDDINVIDDDEEMNMTNDNTKVFESSNEKTRAQLFISNLSTESQLLLLNSVMDSSSGVSDVTNYLHDSNERKSKTIDISYDPLGTSLDGMVKSLNNLGLHAAIVGKATPNNDDTKQKTCRSSLHVEGICCATEVPIVTSILRKLGVEKVSINITSRMVYVDYFPDQISATDLANKLNTEGFGATIKKDGGSSAREKSKIHSGQDTAETSTSFKDTPSSASKFVESTLMCPSLNADEDWDIIEEILQDEDLLYAKVRYISMPNFASKTIKIEHCPKLISAQNVADVLMDCGVYCNFTVLVDGAKEGAYLPDRVGLQDVDSGNWGQGRRCRAIRSCLPRGMGLNIVVSGIFWIVSLIGHFDEER